MHSQSPTGLASIAVRLRGLYSKVLFVVLGLYISLEFTVYGFLNRAKVSLKFTVGCLRNKPSYKLQSLGPRLSLITASLLLFGFGLSTLSSQLNLPNTALAAESSTLNFQMRLLNASGNIVPDGNYHIEFKLYNAANSTGSSQGNCTGDSNCLWTETRSTGNLVRVVNGYFSVNLGSVTAFPSTINWDQEHWLGVRIGGTSGPSWETIELTSDGTATGNKIKLTAVPYAFRAKELRLTSGANSSILQFATPTGTRTITLPNASGTVAVSASGNIALSAAGDITFTGQLPIANGGTGASTSQGAINAISQLTTNGDLLYHNGTNSTRLARGNDTECLKSTATTIQWAACGGSGSLFTDGGTFTYLTATTDDLVIGDTTVAGASFYVDESAGTITVGNSSLAGSIILSDGSSNTVTIDTTGISADYTLTLPTDDGSNNNCLKTDGNGNLSFSNCNNGSGGGGAITLQDAYDAGNTISTDLNGSVGNIAFTLADTATDRSLTVTTATGATGFTSISRADGAGTSDPAQLLLIDNLDTNRAQPIGLKIQSAGGTITTGIDLSDNELDNAIDIGTNFLVASGDSINDFTGNGALVVSSNALTLDATVGADGLSSTTSSGSGLEVLASGLTLLQGCANNDILKWNETTDVWACAADGTGGGVTWDAIGDPAGAGAINFGETVQTLDYTITSANASLFSFNFTNNGGTAGTDSGVVINNAVSTNTTNDLNTENLLLIQQLDTTTTGTTVVDNALKIDSAGSSAITDAIEITNSAGNLTNALNIVDTAGGTLATGINLSGTITTGIVGGATFTTGIDLSSGSSTTDLILDDGLTISQTSDNDLDIVENSLTLNVDFGETTASTITESSASSLEYESTANSAAALKLEATLGGIDIFASGAAAGEDIDIVATGSSVNVRSTEAVTDALVLDASSEASGVRIIAGDNEATAQGNGNDIEFLAEDDTIVALTSGGTFSVISTAAPNVDLVTISNSGQATTAGAVDGLLVDFSQGADAAADINAGINLQLSTTADNASDVLYGLNIDINNNATVAGASVYGIQIENINTAANTTTEGLIWLANRETTADLATDYLLITADTADTTADAIDVSDADLFNAINIGTNFLVASGDSINDFTGNGLTVNSNALVVNLTSSGTTGSTASNSGLEFQSGALTLLKGCADNEILKYTDAGGWACATDGGGSGSTLQGTYDADVDGSDSIIALTTADDSIIIRNPASGGSDSTYILTLDQLATGARGGLSIESAGTSPLLKVRDTTATAQDVLTIADGGATTFRNQTDSSSAFLVQNTSGNTILGVDTSQQRVTVSGTNANAALWLEATGGVQDAVAIFNTQNSDDWAIGLDDSDSANFKISRANALGTQDVLTLTQATGAATFKNFTNSTTAFQIQNAAGTNVLSVDTTKGNVSQSFTSFSYEGGADASGSTNSGTGNDGTVNQSIVIGKYQYVVKDQQGSATACSGTAGSAIGCEFQIYDISIPGSPAYLGGADASGSTNSGSGNRSFNSLDVAGNYAYITTSSDATACDSDAGSAIGCELKVFDISDPSSPTYVGGADISGSTATSAGSGTGSVSSFGHAVSVSGKYLYRGHQGSSTACSQTAGSAVGCEFQIYDISDPARPVFVAGLDADGTKTGTSINQVYDIAIYGDEAYTMWGNDATACSSALGCEFKIIDISDPSNPTYLGGADASGTANGGTSSVIGRSVAVNGRYAYTTYNNDATACDIDAGSAIGCELKIYNVANPAAPAIVGGADASGTTGTSVGAGTGSQEFFSIFVSGRYGYIAQDGDATACSQTAGSAIGCELKIFDLANPASPTYLGGIDISGSSTGTGSLAFRDTYVTGKYVYTTSNADATACSSTPGSAIGCELKNFNVSSLEVVALLSGSLETGTLSVQQGATIADFLNIGGSLSVGQNANIQGNLSVQGSQITLGAGNSGEITAWSSQLAALPSNLTGHALEAVNGYMYVIGGTTTGAAGGAITTTRYAKINADGTVGSFTATSSLPAARYVLESTYANGYIYAIGGADTGANAQDEVYYAKVNSDGSLGTWNSTSLIPAARGEPAVNFYNGYIYVVGGYNGSSQNSVYYAKPNADGSISNWTTDATPFMAARTHAGVIFANGYIYAIGGNGNDTIYTAPVNSDGSIGTWTDIATNAPNTYAPHGVVVLNGYLYLIGGHDGSSTDYSETYYAPIQTGGTLGSFTTSANHLPYDKYEHKSVTYNGYIYAVGGFNDGTISDDIFRTSTSRVQIGGSLDLVGLQGNDLTNSGEISQGSIGGQLTAGNTKVVGTLEVQSQASFSQNVSINGNLSVAGSSIALNTSNTGEIDGWRTTTALTSGGGARAGHQTITANGYVYVLGGDAGSSGGSKQNTSLYSKINSDGTLGTWVTTTVLPYSVYEFSAVYSNGYIFIIGGNTGSTIATVYSAKVNADGTLGSWNQTTSLPGARKAGTAITANGFIYFAGGNDGSANKSEIYYSKVNANGTLSAWMNGTSYGSIRQNTTLAVVGNYLYSFGGNWVGLTSDYATLNPITGAMGSWTSTTALPYGASGSYSHEAVVINGRIYLIAGSDGTVARTDVYFVTPSSNGSLGSWTASSNFVNINSTDYPRQMHSSFTANGFVYLIGGYDSSFTAQSQVFYTSTARTLVGGSLDLVGLNGGDLANGGDFSQGSTGGQLTAGNTKVVGSLEVQSQASFAQNVSINGTLTVAGSSIALNSSNTGEIDGWRTETDTITARYAHSSVVVNGYVYVIGGYNSGTQEEVYYAKLNADGSTGAWANTTSLPAVRMNSMTTTANGYIYVIGGDDGSLARTQTAYYAKVNSDGTVGSWNTTTQLPAVRARGTATVNNGYIYVIGGHDGAGTRPEVYYAKLNADGTVGSWNTTSSVASGDTGRRSHTTVVANGYMYVIGGYDGGPTLENTIYYATINSNGTLGTWNTTNTLPAARGEHGSVVVNGYLYVIGGDNSGNGQTTVYYSKINSDGTVSSSWGTSSFPLTAAREELSVVTANGYIYAIGGAASTNTPQNTVYYTSTSRIQVGGSLDLVGLNGGNLANGGDFSQGSTGGQLTAGNTKVVGTLEVQGQVSFAQGLAVAGDLNVTGNINKVVTLGNITPGTQAISTSTSLVTTTVETVASSSGTVTSITIGIDGLAVVSYKDTTNNYLKVLKCGNESCSSGNTLTNVDTASNVGTDSSIAIGIDGNPIISYRDSTAQSLKVTKCGNPACTSGNITTTVYDTANDVGFYTSIAIGTDGLPVISHHDSTANDLYVTKCGNTACSSGNTTTLAESSDSVGHYSSIAISTDGFPVISHFNDTSDDLMVTKCTNAACTADTTTALDTANQVGQFTSVAIATDGMPIISYYDLGAGTLDLKVAKCTVVDCSSGTSFYTVDSSNTTGQDTSITIGTDGLPIIAYYYPTGLDLRVTKCSTYDCSSGYTSTSVDTSGNTGHDNSIAILPSGLPIISSVGDATLRINRCGNTSCSGSTSVLSGGIELGSTNTSFQNAYINNIRAGNGQSLTLGTNGIDRLTIGLDGTTTIKANSSTIFQVQNAAGASIMDVKQLNTNFGGYAESGAFIDRNSYFGEEWSRDRTDLSADTAAGTPDWGDDTAWRVDESAASTGDCSWSILDDTVNGIMRIQNDDASSICNTYLGDDGTANDPSLIFDADNLPVILMKVRPSHVGANDDLWVGLQDSSQLVANAEPNNGIFFGNSNGTTWTGTTRSASTSTNVTCTGQTISTTQFALLKIEVVSTTNVRFYVDSDVSNGVTWTYCGASTTNIPTAALGSMLKWTSTTVTRNLQTDFFRVWQDDSQAQSSGDLQQPEQSDVQNPTVDPQQQVGIIDFNEATSADVVYDNNVYIKGKLFVDQIVANKVIGLEFVTDKFNVLQNQIDSLLSTQQQNLYENIANSEAQTTNPGNILQGNISVSGNLLLSGELSANSITVGQLSANSISVTGIAQFSSIAVSTTASLQNIIIGGHITTTGDVPQTEVLSAINVSENEELPVVTIDGNDTSGTITITTTGPQIIVPGELVKVTFAQPFSKRPKVFIDASNLSANQIRILKEVSLQHFILQNIDQLEPGQTYVFDYFVIE